MVFSKKIGSLLGGICLAWTAQSALADEVWTCQSATNKSPLHFTFREHEVVVDGGVFKEPTSLGRYSYYRGGANGTSVRMGEAFVIKTRWSYGCLRDVETMLPLKDEEGTRILTYKFPHCRSSADEEHGCYWPQ